MSSPLWKLEGVTLAGSGVPRLAGISLEIGSGVTAVLGCSGAGKTSLLNLLVGYERPDDGTVTRRDAVRNSHSLPVYWVPQGGGLWPHLTAEEHLRLVMSPKAPSADALAMLDSFDLVEKAASRPDELSAGERARLSVARGLATDAAVLVMDEPFANVDLARVGRYWAVVRRRIAASGASLVFATHSPEAVLAEAERVVCLTEGRLLYEGTVADLYWRPRTREEADCLGESNWLSPEEARLWLGREEEKARCFRPEQIAIEITDSRSQIPDSQSEIRNEKSPLVVQSSRFKGSVAEVDLLHEGQEAYGLKPALRTRRFVHRPVADGLKAGMRVALRALVCAMLLAMAGCGGASDPELKFSEVRSWMLPPDGAKLPAPRAVAIGHQDELVVVDTEGRVLVYDADANLLRQWRMPDTSVGKPEGVCVLKDGRIAVADTHYHRVVFFDQYANLLSTLGSEGTKPGQFIYPVALTEDFDGNLYVAEYGGNDRVQKFTPEGKFLLSFGSFGTGDDQFQRPSGVACHYDGGCVYVADAFNNRLLFYSLEGTFGGKIVDGNGLRLPLQFPYGACAGKSRSLYVIEYGAGRLTKATLVDVRQDRQYPLLYLTSASRFGSSGRGEGQFLTPWGVAVDSKGRVFVADTGNRRIVRLTP